MRIRLALIAAPVTIAALTCAAATASAQRQRPLLGAALEWRKQIGELPDSADRRNGLAIRIQGDIPWKKYFGWRIEGAYVQMKYDRSDPNGPTPIRETDIELGGFLRVLQPGAGRVRLYMLGGPVLSLRGSCDISNAFSSTGTVRCGSGKTFSAGWAAGGGVRFPDALGGWTWFAEARVLSNVTAAQGGRLVAVSIGAVN